MKASARWHHAGHPIVYLAESPAAALLEVSVHTACNDIPPEFTLLRVEGPDLPLESTGKLPVDWAMKSELTRDLGSRWLIGGSSALLRVPSAIIPATFNYLLNPLHPDALRYRIAEVMRFPFDSRIKT